MYYKYELALNWLLLVPYGIALVAALVHWLIADVPIGRSRSFLLDRIGRGAFVVGLIVHSLGLVARFGLEQARVGAGGGLLDAVIHFGRFHSISLLACFVGWTAWGTQRRHRKIPILYLPGLVVATGLIAWLHVDGRIHPLDGLGRGPALQLAAHIVLTVGDALLIGACCTLVARILAGMSGKAGARRIQNQATLDDRPLKDDANRGLQTGFASLVQGLLLLLLLSASGVAVPSILFRLIVVGLVAVAVLHRKSSGFSRSIGWLSAWAAAFMVTIIHLDVLAL